MHGNDKFKIEFPNDINEKTKALLLGATMLVVSLRFYVFLLFLWFQKIVAVSRLIIKKSLSRTICILKGRDNQCKMSMLAYQLLSFVEELSLEYEVITQNGGKNIIT